MNQAVIVTGASSGIGLSVARHLAGEYHVVALARRIEKMRREYADEESVTPYKLDLQDTDAITATLRTVREEHGPVHYLVNNAGVNPGARITEVDETALRDTMQVNAFAPVVVMRELLPMMRESDFGRIVNVTSGAALNCPPGAGPYSASKAALNAFTVTAATENEEYDIKINLMSPGPCRTEMTPDAPLDPSACHPTLDHLLNLDAGGPTGRLFWLGYEVPLFPELGDIEWERGRPSDELERVV